MRVIFHLLWHLIYFILIIIFVISSANQRWHSSIELHIFLFFVEKTHSLFFDKNCFNLYSHWRMKQIWIFIGCMLLLLMLPKFVYVFIFIAIYVRCVTKWIECTYCSFNPPTNVMRIVMGVTLHIRTMYQCSQHHMRLWELNFKKNNMPSTHTHIFLFKQNKDPYNLHIQSYEIIFFRWFFSLFQLEHSFVLILRSIFYKTHNIYYCLQWKENWWRRTERNDGWWLWMPGLRCVGCRLLAGNLWEWLCGISVQYGIAGWRCVCIVV